MAEVKTIYVVVKVSTVQAGNAVLIETSQHSSRMGAEEMYHTWLAAAAKNVPGYPMAAVYLMTNEGFVIASEHYVFDVQPEPEPTEQATPTEGE